MARFVVWVEGVDFVETVFDTNKLSVIRGASRALEAIPDVARKALKELDKAIVDIAGGAAQAGFVLTCEEETLKEALTRLDRVFATQGLFALAAADEPPFAHLAIHSAYAPVEGAAIEQAIEAARAKVRVRQLQEPGVRLRAAPDEAAPDGPCEWDGRRRAEVQANGPPRPEEKAGASFSTYWVSRATHARWMFGRSQRQRIYDAQKRLDRDFAFCDDLQEMVRDPPTDCSRPEGAKRAMPVSVANKIAVFYADGDRFGDLRATMKGRVPGTPEAGLGKLSRAIRDRTSGLLTDIVSGLGELDGEAGAARLRTPDEVEKLRFETVLFGGDDLSFFVPSWLGWRLAIQFFDLIKDWEVEPGAPDTRMRFSAGMVFANVKTPIRALRQAAYELCRTAKGDGKESGLEIEVLESVDPPLDGIAAHRERLLGPAWRMDGKSRLTIPASAVADYYRALKAFWIDAPFPASLAHRVLYEAAATGWLTEDAAAAAAAELLAKRARREGAAQREPPDWRVPGTEPSTLSLRFYQALQMRDYVVGAGTWTDDLLPGAPKSAAA